MRVAPRSIAWSRKALNFISALHSTSGLGVRPAWYSLRNSANTRSLYSAAKFTASRSMPITIFSRISLGQQFEGKIVAGEVIVQALLDQRRAVHRRLFLQLRRGKPV